MSDRPRVSAVTPLLVVSDLARSIAFYCEKLGFIEPSVHGDPPCFAMIYRDGFELMLSLAGAAGVHPNGGDGTWDVYLRVSDVAAEAAALAARGVTLAKGPTDTFYEMREIEILDPDGHRLCFAQDTSGEPGRGPEVFEGVLVVGAARLRLVLKLVPSGGGFAGRLDSPDQGATNLLIDAVARDGVSLRFEIKAIGATYESSFSDDGAELRGQWSQGGRTWPLVFRRA